MKKLPKSVCDKLFPVGYLCRYYPKYKFPYGVWKVCNGKNGTPRIETTMNGKVIGKFMIRVS